MSGKSLFIQTKRSERKKASSLRFVRGRIKGVYKNFRLYPYVDGRGSKCVDRIGTRDLLTG